MDPRGRAGRWHNCFSSIQWHNSVTKMFDDFFFDIFLIFGNFDFFRKIPRFFFNQTLYTSSECSSRHGPGFNLMTIDVPKHRERSRGAWCTQFSASLYQPVCNRSAWHHRFWDIALTENRPKAGTRFFGDGIWKVQKRIKNCDCDFGWPN